MSWHPVTVGHFLGEMLAWVANQEFHWFVIGDATESDGYQLFQELHLGISLRRRRQHHCTPKATARGVATVAPVSTAIIFRSRADVSSFGETSLASFLRRA